MGRFEELIAIEPAGPKDSCGVCGLDQTKAFDLRAIIVGQVDAKVQKLVLCCTHRSELHSMLEKTI